MNKVSKDSLATLEFQLTWTSDIGRHTEIHLAEHVNFWRDVLPEEVHQALTGSRVGDHFHFSFTPGKITPPFDADQVVTLKNGQFERRRVNGRAIEPHLGRFYPKGLLKGLPNVFSNNTEPFRCVSLESSRLTVDFNHPLAGRQVELDVIVRDAKEKNGDRGGRLADWTETVTDGPGMQVRSNGSPTDFFSDNPFVRSDEHDDRLFYEKPRLVTHTDSKAIETISTLYGDILKPEMQVLDLMSSWRSHVPESIHLKSLVGLGLNKEEMGKNPQLTNHVVHDLNIHPSLPFDDQAFDAVICSVSVEYMTRPFEVFRDVARILKPGGIFIHTFSNRWFPPKAIHLWQELSEFERMGLVLEYFLDSGAYRNLETFSARGWPRPETDRHYPEIMTADPVYAVWGQKI
jgi:FKBP-type peptidyl-prolyl cis-trans isomerase 2